MPGARRGELYEFQGRRLAALFEGCRGLATSPELDEVMAGIYRGGGACGLTLLGDRDCKYVASFDQVFAAEGIRVMRTPIQAPKANAFAERWVRSVRQECLDWMLIGGRRHLEKVLAEYVGHYNAKRPHRGLGLRVPQGEGSEPVAFVSTAQLRRRDILGGLIHEYDLAA